MTPKQRAERIVSPHYVLNGVVSRPTMVDKIAAEIAEAEMVAWKDATHYAYEDAAKVAELTIDENFEYPQTALRKAAEKIRARAAEACK